MLTDEDCTGSNDLCTGARSISAGGTFTGDTTGYHHESSPPAGCLTAVYPGLDAYFYFDLAVASDVFIDSVGSSFDTVLYLGTTCGGGTLGCNDDVNPVGGPTGSFFSDSAVGARALPPGRYYVTLDAYSEFYYGPYQLHVYITPTDTAGDRCGSPIRIDPGAFSAVGSTCVMSNEASGSCGGAGSEAIYYFALGETRTVTLSTCNFALGTDTVLYIRSDCASNVAERICNNDDPSCGTGVAGSSRVSLSLNEGIYYVFVDSLRADAASCGAYQLDISGI
jgi:hypothetical protein